ncbi:MAG: YjbQ family protein [Candidatus Omnitrophota bacterium]|nr:MAG: YjbQ family protein [Candidatus Omnitrophota bacterium]
MKTLDIHTTKRIEFIDITSQIERLIHQEKIEDGICVVFCPHTTAAVTINENADPSVVRDINHQLSKLIPEGRGYSHMEGNADSHIKSSLTGSSLNIIVEKKALVLGTWQGIYFCEFDGPRRRMVYVKVK